MSKFYIKRIKTAGILLVLTVLLGSCTRKQGWGVLLWADDAHGIPSGTVLPVYIRSNINKVWIVGVPREIAEPGAEELKFEVPLAQLDLLKSRKLAETRARRFGAYALTYAETLQDGLPMREDADNSSRRVYRLREGEIVKILSKANGNPAISATGAPLPGDWYSVLTADGTRGYCFSYRLRLFEHIAGTRLAPPKIAEAGRDAALDDVLAQTWVSEVYGRMYDTGRFDLDALKKNWGFMPGEDSGAVHISVPNMDRGQPLEKAPGEINLDVNYYEIKSLGGRAGQQSGQQTWQILDSEGNGVILMSRLAPDTLTLQISTEGGFLKTLYFTTLPVPLSDLVVQEGSRRDGLIETLLTNGSTYRSAFYGRLHFTGDGRFTWNGFDRLIPGVINAQALPQGRLEMRLFLSRDLATIYDGALSLFFNMIGGKEEEVVFFYKIEKGSDGERGLRLEQASKTNIENGTITNRIQSPIVIFFYAADIETLN
jgi:hypothetical protein